MTVQPGRTRFANYATQQQQQQQDGDVLMRWSENSVWSEAACLLVSRRRGRGFIITMHVNEHARATE